MVKMTYREAVTAGLRQELARDERVVLLGEDIAEPGGVFKTTKGLMEEFGRTRLWDTPISEEAILGVAMGAAMAGLRPVAEIMFADFLATCWDLLANQIAKARYMTNGDLSVPLVVRTASGGGLGFASQHSQSLANWAMAVPGLKVVVPSTAADVKGLIAAAIRDPDPVVVFEQKALYGLRGEVPDGLHVVELGSATTVRKGTDVTAVAVGASVDVALKAAEHCANAASLEVIDLRTLTPPDLPAVVESLTRTGRLMTVEENSRVLGWGAQLMATITEEYFDLLQAPPLRVTTPAVPLPAAKSLESALIPQPERVTSSVLKWLG